jgi:hypothetical protein
MTDLELLTSFPSTGEVGAVHNDWKSAEEALGVKFPASFINFLDALGGAYFDEFLHVHRVGADNEQLDLIATTLVARETMEDSRPHLRDFLAGRGVQPSQLIEWGSTDNADMCFLVPQPAPDDWFVLVVIGRGREFDVFEGSVESYLLKVLQRQIVSEVFPEDFPDDAPSYLRRPDC